MQQLWTEKYFPKNYDEFIGNPEIVEEVKQWAISWQKGTKQQPLLFYGQTGSGKTCLAHLVAKVHGFEIFERNASDFRDKENIEKFVGAASQTATFSAKRRLILIDEVDGIEATADRGGLLAIVNILKHSLNPIILTANDIYSDRNLTSLRSLCKLLEFKKINYVSMAKRGCEILEMEKVKYDKDAIKELAKNSAGDFRSFLLDLQTLSLTGEITKQDIESIGYRERTEKIFKVLGGIFKGKTFDEIKEARNSTDVSDDLLQAWIEENIPRQYTHPTDIAAAFERLSRADIFNTRILRRQYWGFLRYSTDIMTVGVALSRSHNYEGFTPFQFPTILSKLASTKSTRTLKNRIAKKIGKAIHSSANRVLSADFSYLQILMQNSELAAAYAAQFDLNEEELAFLLNIDSNSKKVERIMNSAQELKQQLILSKRTALALSTNSAEQKNLEIHKSKKLKPVEKTPSKQRKLF